MLQFQKAIKYGSKLRMALIGTSGSGKTYSALSIASHLGKRIAFVDTERGSARKYSDLFSFDVLELESFAVERYLEAIHAAEQAKYDVLIIDSLSHAWSGKDGLLEFVDMERAKSKTGNAFTDGWRKATPLHNSLIDAILGLEMHVIVCMRSKTEYVMQDDPRTGKKMPVKIGMQPVQREGMEYEFDVIGDMNMDHQLVVGKTRCNLIDGKVFPLPGAELAGILNEWLGGDAAPVVQTRPAEPVRTVASQPAPTPAESPELAELREQVKAQLTKMMSINIYPDGSAVRDEMIAVLGVDHLSKAMDAENLSAYLQYLVKRVSSDTPFSGPETHAQQRAEAAPEPAKQSRPRKSSKCPECGIVAGHDDSCSLNPDNNSNATPETNSISTADLCSSLLDTLDAEIQSRNVPESLADAYCVDAAKYSEQGKPDSIKTLIDAVKGYSKKTAPVDEPVKNLQGEIKKLLQKMVNEDIDGFAQSVRLSNSVKHHLEVSKLVECTDAERLAAYATHLHAIIANHTKENVA